ncbi:MAG TPA: ATP-binding cassette domain-containing protein [Acidimicrobiales bacterium]|nr:ATP-binding cassette domain-containing protein [Acidimicrobiales bacterium]
MTLTSEIASAPQGGTSAGNRLECFGVKVHFGGLVAVNDVDLAVPPATIVGLVGPNGAGKSTLFGVLSGLLRPTDGRVVMDGQDITSARPQVRADLGLARTFQHPEIFSGLTIRDHLTLGFRVRNSKRRIWSDLLTMGSVRAVDPEERATVDELVALLGLESLADRPALGLPLGVARLVELGRALSTSPTVLLLDEPSSGLDSAATDQFEATVRRVTDERGVSVLLVEHDVELVMRLCAAVHVLDFGVLIASGSPDQVRSDPAVRAAYLGEEITTDGSRDAGVDTDGVADDERSFLNYDALKAVEQETAGTGAPVVQAKALKVENLCVRYGDAIALSGVSFDVDTGQVLVILGPNGAGKSSLARAVSGLVPPVGGSIRLQGQDISGWPAYRIRRAGMLHLPEGRGVFRELTVVDNLRMAVSHIEGRQARQEAVQTALDIFPALAARRRQLGGLLSGGEQQMLSLARALATSPKLLVADEMSLGLAPLMVDLVFEGLERARQAGVTIIMIEQYVHRALAFADRCLVLQRGQAVWNGPAKAAGSEVLRHYLGEAVASGV